MTVTIPEWVLWIGGSVVALVIIILAVIGFIGLRAFSR